MEWKGLAWTGVPHHLWLGEQYAPDYLALNLQGFVPALEMGGDVLTQSLAICEFLDETHAQAPLLPKDTLARAKVGAAAQVIACDIHPKQNLKILKINKKCGMNQAAADGWAAEIIEAGLEAFASLIAGNAGPYCFDTDVTLADVLMVPQLGNTRRFGARFDFGRIADVEAACMQLPAFIAAAPENQPDAE